MARRVYLHLGVPKSGTTYLQTIMWSNRRLLRERGWLYPGSKRMDHYHAAHEVRGGRSRLAENAGAWDRLVGEANAWEGQALISHEFFSLAKAGQARRALGDLEGEVHLVLTVRDYVRQFAAAWQEALKMGSPLGLDEFLDAAMRRELPGAWSWNSQDVPAILRRWSADLPPERVHVVTVPPPGGPRDALWTRWCEALELDAAGLDLEGSFGNESLGVDQVAVLQRVVPHLSGPLGEQPARHRWLRQYLGHEVLAPQRGERFGLRERHVAELREASTDAVARLSRRGYRVHGDLQDLVPGPDAGTGPHPDDVPEREVLDSAARAIEQMVRDVMVLTAERDARPARSARAAAASEPRPVRRAASRLRGRLSRVSRRGGAR